MQKSILSSILLLGAVCAQANNYTVTSPNGKLVMNVKCEGGKASYTVDLNGKQMLAASALGLVANYGDFSLGLTMGTLKGAPKLLTYVMDHTKKLKSSSSPNSVNVMFSNLFFFTNLLLISMFSFSCCGSGSSFCVHCLSWFIY